MEGVVFVLGLCWFVCLYVCMCVCLCVHVCVSLCVPVCIWVCELVASAHVCSAKYRRVIPQCASVFIQIFTCSAVWDCVEGDNK